MICKSTQFTELPFSVTHTKPHGFCGLSKHYHFGLGTKLGQDICLILRIPCAFLACKSMLEKP